jgi:hypothetical protein
MIDIGDSAQVLKQAAVERLKPKPKPVIEVGSSKLVVVSEPEPHVEEQAEQPTTNNQQLLPQLEREQAQLLTERAKLSSQIWKLVANGASQDELKLHYERIEAFRQPLIDHYDKIAYVKKHGSLPEVPTTTNQQPTTLLELRELKRKLSDKRCKLKVKLQPSAKPSKPDQLLNWQMELAQAEAQYADVEERIKQMQLK